jgi:hypothetical protein
MSAAEEGDPVNLAGGRPNKNANENPSQTWWAKLLEKIGLGNFVKR